MNPKPKVQILDCTIRDGGYINNWHFDKKVVREAYRACSKAGVDYVEIGYKGTEKHFDKAKYGLWRFTPEEAIREAVKNTSGAKLSVMADHGKISAEDFIDRKDSVVALIRIAAHGTGLKDALKTLEQLKTKGYEVALNAMGYSNYTDAQRREFASIVKGAGLDFVYIADSYGSIYPNEIKGLFEPILEVPGIQVGFHPHNNLQMAFANTLEAIQCGVHVVDSTIYGMGRAAGNMQTEVLVSFLEKMYPDRYNAIPLLNLIDQYFVPLQKEMPWGYQLPYMLSGMFQCHPDYAKTLVDQREYTIEDVWKAMRYIKEKNPVGYSKTVLSEFINEGHIGSLGETAKSSAAAIPGGNGHGKAAVPYLNRHTGRDFLVLANGPSLKEYKPKIERFIAEYNPIILGANFLGGLFTPDYHAFNNKRRFAEYAESVAPESKLLLGQYIPEELIRDYVRRDYERLFYRDDFAEFDIADGVITTNCRTISVLLLGVAIAMGAKRVFAAGMDGYVGVQGSHFYEEKDDKENPEMIVERHRWCQRYLSQIDEYLRANHREEIHILTPTSYKSHYKGIDNYLAALSK
jgi:4-hydroxy 2-oxovalerate aldolase